LKINNSGYIILPHKDVVNLLSKHTYMVPEYYPEFHCKMGACRRACCEGWPVSVSMADYFRLLGEDCSPELRRRIDTSLHLHKYPTPDEYAFIAPRWDGSCPLRHEDGRCRLQCEMGEEALSYVCRLYPRGVRTEGVFECSCANSCEAVIELFLDRGAPLEFIPMELEIDLPSHAEPGVFDESFRMEREIRMFLIKIMQNRACPLPIRLMTTGDYIRKLYTLTDAGDYDAVSALINSEPAMSSLENSAITDEHMTYALSIAEKMTEYAEKHSSAVHEYGLSALEYFGTGDGAAERYKNSVYIMQKLLPGWETVFEHMLVNHMYFERYPFHIRIKDPTELFSALCGTYGLIRFLSLGWISRHPTREDFTDVTSAAFRLIEHTSFDLYSSALLKDFDCVSKEKLFDFVRL